MHSSRQTPMQCKLPQTGGGAHTRDTPSLAEVPAHLWRHSRNHEEDMESGKRLRVGTGEEEPQMRQESWRKN